MNADCSSATLARPDGPSGTVRSDSADAGRARTERGLPLVQDLLLSIAAAPTLSVAMVETLRQICLETGWDYGEAWVRSAGGDELVGGDSWMRRGSGLEEFSAGMRRCRFRRGVGLAGRAWESGRPTWTAELGEHAGSGCCRPGEARAAGLRAAAAVPILAGAEVVAVLLFFLREPRAGDDERLLDLVRVAVAPLGAVIQHKRAEGALAQAQERLSLALEASGAAVWSWNIEDNRLDDWNPRFRELYGFAAADVTPTFETWLERIHPQDRQRLVERIGVMLSTPGDDAWDEEFRVLHPRLGERWLSGLGRVLRDASGRAVRATGINLDVTQHKRNEEELARHREQLEVLVAQRTNELEASHEQLRMADRLASIGTLAAGLGHDMNNVLLPVRAHLNALRAEAARGALTPGAAEHLDAIRKSTAYLQQLADGLHFLAADPEREDEQSGTTDLRAWWSQSGVLIAKAVPKHVRITASFPRRLPRVAVTPAGLTQAVLNLVVNAGEAIPVGRQRPQGRVRIAAAPAPGAPSVRLSVSDNGLGMSAEVRRRAFEMFFTTKPRGLGTGLGLPLVRRFADRIGGAVEIDSAAGKGTTVSLVMPAAPSEGRGHRSAVVTIADGRSGALVCHMLRAAGVEPVPAPDPAETDLWIVEPAPERLATALAWRSRRPRGRLTLFGPPGRRSAAAWGQLDPLIITRPHELGEVRAAIGRALEVPERSGTDGPGTTPAT